MPVARRTWPDTAQLGAAGPSSVERNPAHVCSRGDRIKIPPPRRRNGITVRLWTHTHAHTHESVCVCVCVCSCVCVSVSICVCELSFHSASSLRNPSNHSFNQSINRSINRYIELYNYLPIYLPKYSKTSLSRSLTGVNSPGPFREVAGL